MEDAIRELQKEVEILNEKIGRLLDYLRGDVTRDSVMREWFEDLSNRFDVIEPLLIVLASGGDQQERSEARRGILENQQKRSIKRQLKIQRNNLNLLNEQRAAWGAQTPLSLLNEISTIQEVVSNLETELGEL